MIDLCLLWSRSYNTANIFVCLFLRDVDNFIEKLTGTISFLTNIEGDDSDTEDDFVPFI